MESRSYIIITVKILKIRRNNNMTVKMIEIYKEILKKWINLVLRKMAKMIYANIFQKIFMLSYLSWNHLS